MRLWIINAIAEPIVIAAISITEATNIGEDGSLRLVPIKVNAMAVGSIPSKEPNVYFRKDALTAPNKALMGSFGKNPTRRVTREDRNTFLFPKALINVRRG